MGKRMCHELTFVGYLWFAENLICILKYKLLSIYSSLEIYIEIVISV